MAINTLDELSPEAYDKAEKAFTKFRKSRKSRSNEHELYETLTNLGLSGESADEYINLELE